MGDLLLRRGVHERIGNYHAVYHTQLFEEIPITPLDVRCGRVAEYDGANDVLFVGALPMKPCVEVAADQRGSMRRALPKAYTIGAAPQFPRTLPAQNDIS